MRMRLAAMLLWFGPALTQAQEAPPAMPADIIELSPDLYLLTHRARLEGSVDVQLDAIERANDFAATRGGVAVPIVGRFVQSTLTLKVYQYQFRVMSREQAVASRPVLADAVITVNNTGICAPNAALTTVLPDLHGIAELYGLDLLSRLPPTPELAVAPSASPTPGNGPGTMCLPGQICQPAQLCLPGWECTPGAPPSMEPPKPVTPPG